MLIQESLCALLRTLQTKKHHDCLVVALNMQEGFGRIESKTKKVSLIIK